MEGAVPSMHGKLGWLVAHRDGKHLIIGEGPSPCAARRALSPGNCLPQLQVAAGLLQPGHSPCADSCS